MGLYVARKADAEWLKALGILVCLLGTLLVFMSTDETVINVFYRSRYLLAIPWYICTAWIIGTRVLPALRWPSYAPALTLAAVAIMGFGYIWQFNNQARYSAMATPATVAALDQIRGYEDGAAIISNSYTLSHWVSALNKVPSPHTWTWHPPRRFVETDKAVGWILIDRRFPNYNARAPGIFLAPNGPALWDVTGRTPWLTEFYREGTTQVWRIELS